MRVNDFYNVTELIKQDILSNQTEYLKLLKVIGNNQRYDFLSQLNIYSKNPNAIACAKFDFWRKRFNRTVMRGEKGIPIMEDYGSYRKIDYIFDISQTVSKNKEVNEVKLWSFNPERHDLILSEMVADKGYGESDNLSANLYSLARIYGEDKIYSLANEMRIAEPEQTSFMDFIYQSISYSLAGRFNIDYEIDENLVKENYLHLDRISLMSLGYVISDLVEEIIEETMERTRSLELNDKLTERAGLDYNKDRDTNKGGRENVIRRDDQDTGNKDRVWTDGIDGRNRLKNQGENPRPVGRGEGIYQGISQSDLFSDETGLSSKQRGTESIRDVDGAVRGESTSQTFDGNTKESNQPIEDRKREHDGGLEFNRTNEEEQPRRIPETREEHDVSVEGNNHQGDRRGLNEENTELGKGAEQASFFNVENDLEPIIENKEPTIFDIDLLDYSEDQIEQLESAIRDYKFSEVDLEVLLDPNLPSWKMEQLKWLVDEMNQNANIDNVYLRSQALDYLRKSEIEDISKFIVLKDYLWKGEIIVDQARVIEEAINIDQVPMKSFVEILDEAKNYKEKKEREEGLENLSFEKNEEIEEDYWLIEFNESS